MNLENEINKKASLWIMKQKEGLNIDESKEFDLWIKNSHNKKAYDENIKLLNACKNLDIDFINEIEDEVNEQKSFFFRNKYIAACLVACCIMIFTFFEVRTSAKPTFVQNYSSLDKKQLSINLPDSSIIDLDIKSQVQVSFYENKRTVNLLKGKAFFDVAKDKDKPFIIKSGKTVIEVLGTKFEVVNLDNKTTVNVLEGLVKVSQVYNENGDLKTFSRLSKSEVLTLNNKGKVLNFDKTKVKNIATWKNNEINFEKHTLKRAFDEFKRYSNIGVKFESYELSQLKVTGKFSTNHYDDFLDAITVIYPIEIKKEKTIVKVLQKN